MPTELRRLSNWLQAQGVEEVVMESTAQYWRSVWMELEPHMTAAGLMWTSAQEVLLLFPSRCHCQEAQGKRILRESGNYRHTLPNQSRNFCDSRLMTSGQRAH